MSATNSPSIIFSAAAPTIEDIAAIARRHARIEVSAEVEARIVGARAVVDRYTESDLPVYGLTTGLGAGVDTRLATEDLVAFQMRVPQARSVGVGEPLAEESMREMMAVRAAGMAAGGSGVSLKVFQGLIAA
ncbi:aromatic amino acid lyase, partial [Rhizobium ruizarguesonis]